MARWKSGLFILVAFLIAHQAAAAGGGCRPQFRRKSYLRQGSKSYALPDQDQCGKVPLKPYIAGGITADPGDYPAYVRVDVTKPNANPKIAACGGTLISDRHVLTAAHCLERDAKYNVVTTIFAPGTGDEEADSNYEVKKACRHPKHSSHRNVSTYDLAILTLYREVNFTDYVQPACLPETKAQGNQFWAVGLGQMGDGKPHAEQLQALPVAVTACDHGDKHRSKICFEPSEEERQGSTCAGDTGGPVFGYHNNRLTVYGVVSYGPDTCRPGTGGKSVYANTEKLRNDISDLVQRCTSTSTDSTTALPQLDE